jgi:dynein heavy chain
VVREKLLDDVWKPYLTEKSIKIAKDPLDVVCHAAIVAGWSNEGLPTNRISTEIAAITHSCQCWPLFTDPQFHSTKWIRKNQEKVH